MRGFRGGRLGDSPARRTRRVSLIVASAALGTLVGTGGACRRAEDLPPAQALAKAWEEFEFYNYAATERLVRPLVDGRTTGEPHAEALFALANSFEHRQPRTESNLKQACAYYRNLIEAHANSPLVPWARLAQARIVDLGVESGRSADAARRLYEAVIEHHPGHEAAEEATLRLAQTLMNDPDPDQKTRGIQTLTRWLAAHPKSRLASSMHQVVGHAYLFGPQDYRRAVDHYVAAAELGIHNHSQVGNVYYRIAYLAQHKLRDYALARAYYRKLIDEVFRDRRAYRARVAIRRMDARQEHRP